MGERARVRLIRASQSGELRETFRQLAEIEGPDGPKYPRRVLLELAARIVGRAYESMLLELCHLVRAALLAGGATPGGRNTGAGRSGGAGFEWLFWGVEEARAGAFRAAFFPLAGPPAHAGPPPAHDDRSPSGPGAALHIGDEAVTLAYCDGGFEVRYGRMADLAAMMELLVSTVGYRALVAALDPLAAPVLDRDAVSGAARDLARRLYGWLGDHLPTAQAQRKFHAMIAFVEEARGTDFTEEDIDDEAILRFWLRHGASDGGGGTPGAGDAHDTDGAGGMPGSAGTAGSNPDFRGYRNTFLAFLSLARVLAAGAEIGRFERRTPIGTDFEAGEIDPAADSPVTEGAPEEDPLARLEEEPAAAVKALNRRELALLQLPVGESAGVRRLPRSYLRAECFGPVQNRLSQALRRRAGAAELAALIAAGPDPDYRSRIESLEQAEAHLRRVAKACLYVLHRLARGGGDAGEDDGRGADGSNAGYGDADGGSGGTAPDLDFRLLGEARTAFRGLNRAGFEPSAPHDPRLAPAYGALAERLPTVSERLGAVLHTLGPPAAWEAGVTATGSARPSSPGSTGRGRTRRGRVRTTGSANKEGRAGTAETGETAENAPPGRPARTRCDRREETDEQGMEREERGGAQGGGGGVRRPPRRRAVARRRRGAAVRGGARNAAGAEAAPLCPPPCGPRRRRAAAARGVGGAPHGPRNPGRLRPPSRAQCLAAPAASRGRGRPGRPRTTRSGGVRPARRRVAGRPRPGLSPRRAARGSPRGRGCPRGGAGEGTGRRPGRRPDQRPGRRRGDARSGAGRRVGAGCGSGAGRRLAVGGGIGIGIGIGSGPGRHSPRAGPGAHGHPGPKTG